MTGPVSGARERLAEAVVAAWAKDAGEDPKVLWGLGAALDASLNPFLDALLPTVESLADERAAEVLEEAARRVEQLRPHIPPSSDPDRRTRIVQRSSFNRAASAVRAAPSRGGAGQ